MNIKKNAVRSILVALLIFPGVFFACTDQTSTKIGATQKSRHVIDTLMTSQQIPGLQISVWQRGEIVLSEGFGYADLEQEVPIEPNTKMRIGSVSKTLTSAAVGKLYEQGHLDLDAFVQEYVPYFPEKEYPITVQQVAGHTAGIRHYKGSEFLRNERFKNVKESLEIFAEDTLLFKPGTEYSYSSYGWNLISAVVEEAAGTPFLTYMENEILTPLGMDETIAEYTDSLINHRTSYYTYGDNGAVLNAPAVDNSYKWAGGGYIGTTNDLISFGKNIFWGDFLEPETVEMLTESLVLDSGEKTNYGIGWRSGTDEEGQRYYGHSGGSVGGTTRFVVFPDQEVIVAMITNIGNVSYYDTHLVVADFLISEKSDISR